MAVAAVAPLSDLYYRDVQQEDHDQVKGLHEKLFPVRYSDEFYMDICSKKGVYSDRLFATLVVDRASERIVGFIFAEFTSLDKCEEGVNLVDRSGGATSALYILTLGVADEYRRRGLAAALVDSARQYALLTRSCGALYLHVIHYNAAAIRFYESLHFEYFETLDRFYVIDGASYSAYMYVSYVNGHAGPLLHRLRRTIGTSIARGIGIIFSWLVGPKAALAKSAREVRVGARAGDDIV